MLDSMLPQEYDDIDLEVEMLMERAGEARQLARGGSTSSKSMMKAAAMVTAEQSFTKPATEYGFAPP